MDTPWKRLADLAGKILAEQHDRRERDSDYKQSQSRKEVARDPSNCDN